MPPVPVLYALLLCDLAIREEGTRKFTLVGVFTHIWANRFPALHPALTVYFSLTDAQGAYDLGLHVRNLATGEELLPGMPPIPVRVTDRFRVVEEAIQIRNLTFPQPGKYEVAIEGNGVPIGSRVFWVAEAEPAGGPSS